MKQLQWEEWPGGGSTAGQMQAARECISERTTEWRCLQHRAQLGPISSSIPSVRKERIDPVYRRRSRRKTIIAACMIAIRRGQK